MKPGRVSAVALTAALLLGACSGGPEEAEGSDGTPDGGTTGTSTITVAIGATASRGLDPANIANFTPSSEGNFLPAVFGMLAYLDAETGEVVPDLAESLEASDDGSVWTLTLRPGLTFSDGTPFDAAAVVHNYTRHQDPELGSRLAGTVEGMEFEAVDETTVRITLPEPNFHFDKTLAVSLTYIGSPTAMEEDPEGFARAPVGAGPYMVAEVVDDSHLTLVRNENYGGEHTPSADELVFRVIPDPQQRVQAVVAGEADIAVPGSDMSHLDAGVDQGLEATSVQLSGGTFFIFNTARPPFDDPLARRAVSTALDPQEIVDIADGGSEAVGLRSLFAESSPFHDASRLFGGSDLDRAQALLDEIAAAGEPLSFTLALPQGGQWRRYGETVQSRLGALDNVTVEVDFLENAALAAQVFGERNYDMSGFNLFMPDPEPNLFNLIHSEGRDNHSQYANPELDEAIEGVWGAPDDDARADLYATIEEILIEDVPVWPLKGAAPYVLHHDDVSGLTMHSEGALLWDRVEVSG